ncbi:MAG: hypothetical protein ACTSWK_07280, partial [Promethearchaeota archaeon]
MAIHLGQDADGLKKTFEKIDDTTGAIPVDIITGAGGSEIDDGDAISPGTGKLVLGKDNTDHAQAIAVDTDGQLQVEVTETIGIVNHGDIDSDPDGMVVMGKDPSNNIYAMELDANGNLNVNCVAGGAGGHQYNDGDTPSPIAGFVMQGVQSGTTVRDLCADGDGHLQVDVLSGGGAGAQYTEGAVEASPTGTANLMQQSNNTLTMPTVDASGHQQIDIVDDNTLVSDGSSAGGEAGRLVMGVDDSANAQILAVNTDGEIAIQDGGNS